MIFKNIDYKDEDICYLCEYVPSNRCDTVDKRSRDLVLAYKNKVDYAIELVTNYLNENVGTDFAIVVVPSSSAENNGTSASHEVASKLANDKLKIVDASMCWRRTETIQKAHMTSGKRSADRLIESSTIDNPELIKDRDVLVIDDITTSGSSFEAARMMLKNVGAKDIVNFAVGKTITSRNLHFGFIINLDGFIEEDQAEIIFLCSKINSIKGQYCFILDKATEGVIQQHASADFMKLLGASQLLYADKIEDAYFRAKQFMQIFEPCITVVGKDFDVNITNRICMNSVQITSAESKAAFKYAKLAELLDNFEEVISPVSDVREQLLTDYERNHED